MRKLAIAMVLAAPLAATSAPAQDWSARVKPAPAAAQPKPAAAKSPPPQRAAQPSPRPAQAGVEAQVGYLVRTALLTLNDANRTGNYTVLRDLAAPSFRDRHSAADLALVFAELRRTGMDLSIAALLTPELDQAPHLEGGQRLRIKGSYPTEPNRIVFDIVFEQVASHWRLGGLAISTRPSRTASLQR